MKSVLMSIQPKWCELIANGKKTVEVRKTRPKCEVPFKVYIYCTQGDALAYPCLNNPKFAIHKMTTSHSLHGRKLTKKERKESDYTFANGKVIGEFVCNSIEDFKIPHPWLSQTIRDDLYRKSCVAFGDLYHYSKGGGKLLCAWHISELKIYDEPKELSEFRTYNVRICLENGYPMPTHEIKRPPQSWCYVEGGGES